MSKFDAETWESYLNFLKDWTTEHSDMEFVGMSPPSYDEWYHGPENEEYNNDNSELFDWGAMDAEIQELLVVYW